MDEVSINKWSWFKQMLVLKFLSVLYVSGFSSSIAHGKTDSKAESLTFCGVDRLPPNGTVQEGLGVIESFPWFGLLIYPIGHFNPTTTTVILIASDLALSSALDIDSYPKKDFRARSRVVLGNSCSGPYLRVRDYAFYPDYSRGTFSTLAILQLDARNSGLKMIPICPPPEHFTNGDAIYAFTMVNEDHKRLLWWPKGPLSMFKVWSVNNYNLSDCYNSSMVVVFKMEHVDSTRCRDFYRSMGLDIETMWPSFSVCARGIIGYHCIWRSGTALVIRHNGQWKLLGVGISGPGCQSPSRFLDYGMYHPWVKRTMRSIGHPTISRIAPNQLILRRTIKNIPRYGKCDPEESKMEIYSGQTTVVPPFGDDIEIEDIETAYFNVTLLRSVNYHCVVLQVWNELGSSASPTIKIRRWCTGLSQTCDQSLVGPVEYFIEIKFRHICSFNIAAYGAEINNDDADYAKTLSRKS